VQMNSSSSVIANQQAKEVQTQISQLQVDRNQNSEVYGNRGGNRKALGIGKRTRDWSPSNSLQPSEEFRLPNNLPWREALVLESRTSLGDGQLPPGHRSANERTLLGIDLVGDQPVALTVRGLGGDVTVELALTRPTSSWWPLLSGALLALTLSAGAFFVQRRK
jgi:hypothetical protein